jgi:hypothetical protein
MLTAGPKLLFQAQYDGFDASATFPGLTTVRMFPVSATDMCSERTAIREC